MTYVIWARHPAPTFDWRRRFIEGDGTTAPLTIVTATDVPDAGRVTADESTAQLCA